MVADMSLEIIFCIIRDIAIAMLTAYVVYQVLKDNGGIDGE
jgi:hypothetical protein